MYLKNMSKWEMSYHSGTDWVVEDVMGERSCVATASDYHTPFCLVVQASSSKNGQNSVDLFRVAREMTATTPWSSAATRRRP